MTGKALPTLSLSDATLDYDLIGGSGPLVVQLHGLTSSRARDRRLGLDLTTALEGHRVLRYDARGHGRSSGPPDDPASYSWPRLADDLLALLDHVAPGEQVHGLGPSMGSATLLHAALREPRRFATLTLLVPPTAWESRVPQRQRYLANADLIEQHGMTTYLEQALSNPVVPAMADAPQTLPDVPEELLPALLRGASASDLPAPAELAAITTPALVLAWSDDPMHPESTANALAETLPDARLVLARTPYGLTAWPALFADHLAVHPPVPGAGA